MIVSAAVCAIDCGDGVLVLYGCGYGILGGCSGATAAVVCWCCFCCVFGMSEAGRRQTRRGAIIEVFGFCVCRALLCGIVLYELTLVGPNELKELVWSQWQPEQVLFICMYGAEKNLQKNGKKMIDI